MLPTGQRYAPPVDIKWSLRDVLLRKNCSSFGFCPNEGGGTAQFFLHLFISAFLVNEMSLYLSKCQ